MHYNTRVLVNSCRFLADDGPTTVSNARALHQKPTEARETSAPKPSDSDVSSGRTKEQPSDAQSSAQKALSGVPTLHRHTRTYTRTYVHVLYVRTLTPASRIANMHSEHICQNCTVPSPVTRLTTEVMGMEPVHNRAFLNPETNTQKASDKINPEITTSKMITHKNLCFIDIMQIQICLMTVMSDADGFTDYFIIRKTDVTGFQFLSSIIFKLFSQKFICIC